MLARCPTVAAADVSTPRCRRERISSDIRSSSALELKASRTKSSIDEDEDEDGVAVEFEEEELEDPEGDEGLEDGAVGGLPASAEAPAALATPKRAAEIGDTERDPTPPTERLDHEETRPSVRGAERLDWERWTSRSDGEPVAGALPIVNTRVSSRLNIGFTGYLVRRLGCQA